MAVVKISNQTLSKIGEKFMDMGNLSAVGLTFGSLLSKEPLNPWLFSTGFLAFVFLYAIGIYLCERGGKEKC